MTMIDGLAPGRIIAPRTEEEVAAALAEARSASQAVIPTGGGTLLHVGEPPSRYDLGLATGELTGIVEYNPADLTMVVRSGTTLAELDAELARRGQFLPLDPPLPERATVGGSLAANASGPWRSAYGSARDMVIGMRMALPGGEIARSGGRVVKNVAGYDLAKLFIGSYGTLGVIVEAAFKLFPRPPATRMLFFECASTDEAFRLSTRLRANGPGVLSLVVVNERYAQALGLSAAAVLITLGGSPRAVAGMSGSMRSVAERAPGTIEPAQAGTLFAALRDFPARAAVRVSTPRPRRRSSPLSPKRVSCSAIRQPG